MNRSVYRLLKGYLFRSGWLYAVLGVLHFILTGFFWAWGYDRVPIVGVLLGMWGAIAAVNRHSLVWRSLPLTYRDASLFRWWGIAGVPGIYLTIVTLIAWDSQRSSGFPIPDAAVLSESILAIWSVLGILAVLTRAAGWATRKSWTTKIIGASAGALLLLAYGVPVGQGARPYSWVFIGAGLILLCVSATRAHRGLDWRWTDLADRGTRSRHQRWRSWPANRYGLSVIVIPLAQHTAIFAVVGTVIIVSLQQVFPRASMVLFWGYFIGVSSAGFLLTYRVRMAFQALRCLPLSAKQLAGLLQLFGALPGLVTLGLTLLINRVVLKSELDIGLMATFAFLTIASQVFPVAQTLMTHRNKLFSYWLPLFQRLWVPFYLVLTAAGWSEAYYGRFSWFRWPLQAGGVVLCIIGYFVLVQQLRSGIRPSSNENAFSPGRVANLLPPMLLIACTKPLERLVMSN
jgi:hypothetical protein